LAFQKLWEYRWKRWVRRFHFVTTSNFEKLIYSSCLLPFPSSRPCTPLYPSDTLVYPLSALTPQIDELFGDQTPSQPLLGRSNSFDARPDGGPLRRSHSHASFRKGMPHEHSDAAEPPKSNRPRHRRTLSGSASLPGRGGPGVEGVRDWWSSSRNGSQTFSRPGSRSTTPGPEEGGRRNYQTVRQSEEEEAIL